jgi:hypothetical protein
MTKEWTVQCTKSEPGDDGYNDIVTHDPEFNSFDEAYDAAVKLHATDEWPTVVIKYNKLTDVLVKHKSVTQVFSYGDEIDICELLGLEYYKFDECS